MFSKAGSKGSKSESIYVIFEKEKLFHTMKNVSIKRKILNFQSPMLFKGREKFSLSNVFDNDEN